MHRFRRQLLAVVVVISVVVVAPAVARASEGLHIDAVSTYEVVPDDARVFVTIEVEATNATPSTTKGNVTTRYFYEGFYLPLPPEAENVVALDEGREAQITFEDSEDGSFQVALVRFRSNLFYNRSRSVTVTYEIPGGEPRSEDVTRVNAAFVAIALYAFGDPENAEVRLLGLEDFEVTLDGSHLRLETDDEGREVRVDRNIVNPPEWFVWVNALNNEGLVVTDRTFANQAVRIRAWPGDEEWFDSVSETLDIGLPALMDVIGLGWPVEDTLVVTQAIAPNLFGFGGWYFVDEDEIEIGESVDRAVVLHEASHAWFNGSLFTERWIGEGLAEEVASIVLREVFDERQFPQAISRLDSNTVKLNAWEIPGFRTELSDAREAYGYNASWSVIHDIAKEIGQDAVSDVLEYADSDRIAYVGRSDAEPWTDPDDWRRLLDLFEEVGGSEKATDLFADFVVRTDEADDLEDRAKAREKYQAFQETTGRQAPVLIRRSLSDWEFDDAIARMDDGLAVYESELALIARATAAGLNTQDVFSLDFEMTRGSFSAVSAAIGQYERALDALLESETALAAERSTAVQVGLWRGEDPGDFIAAARAAYERGDIDSVPIHAALAKRALVEAEAVGRQRIVYAGGIAGFVALVILGLAIRAAWKRRRRGTSASPQPTVDAANDLGDPGVAVAVVAGSESEPEASIPVSAPGLEPPQYGFVETLEETVVNPDVSHPRDDGAADGGEEDATPG
ncbi:hypothetical protein BMS3Bbin02_00405 [bacterium BMS3Bbin02]|nr:hypothetical protein BMS3Bbin02_00405 [bacterium BMS3Bbin02]